MLTLLSLTILPSREISLLLHMRPKNNLPTLQVRVSVGERGWLQGQSPSSSSSSAAKDEPGNRKREFPLLPPPLHGGRYSCRRRRRRRTDRQIGRPFGRRSLGGGGEKGRKDQVQTERRDDARWHCTNLTPLWKGS